jgi:hypothetical protein
MDHNPPWESDGHSTVAVQAHLACEWWRSVAAGCIAGFTSSIDVDDIQRVVCGRINELWVFDLVSGLRSYDLREHPGDWTVGYNTGGSVVGAVCT